MGHAQAARVSSLYMHRLLTLAVLQLGGWWSRGLWVYERRDVCRPPEVGNASSSEGSQGAKTEPRVPCHKRRRDFQFMPHVHKGAGDGVRHLRTA